MQTPEASRCVEWVKTIRSNIARNSKEPLKFPRINILIPRFMFLISEKNHNNQITNHNDQNPKFQNREKSKCTTIQDYMGLIKWLLTLFKIWNFRFLRAGYCFFICFNFRSINFSCSLELTHINRCAASISRVCSKPACRP